MGHFGWPPKGVIPQGVLHKVSRHKALDHMLSRHIWLWVKSQIVPPVNLPIPTKIGSKMGAAPNPQNGIPLVLTHGHLNFLALTQKAYTKLTQKLTHKLTHKTHAQLLEQNSRKTNRSPAEPHTCRSELRVASDWQSYGELFW